MLKLFSERRDNLGTQISSTLGLAIKQPLPDFSRRIKLLKSLFRLFPPKPFRVLEASNSFGCVEDRDGTATGLFNGSNRGLGEPGGMDLNWLAKVVMATTEYLETVLDPIDACIDKRLDGYGLTGIKPPRIDQVLDPVQIDFCILFRIPIKRSDG